MTPHIGRCARAPRPTPVTSVNGRDGDICIWWTQPRVAIERAPAFGATFARITDRIIYNDFYRAHTLCESTRIYLNIIKGRGIIPKKQGTPT
jgi:hypothetical protein